MDVIQEIANEVYDSYEVNMDEVQFVWMTEGLNEPLIVRAEKIICASKGITYEDYCNSASSDTYNDIFVPAQLLATNVLSELQRRWSAA